MLDSRRLSLKGATILSLLFLGAVALVLIFLTTEIYHQLVLKNESANLSSIIKIEAEIVRENHFETVSELAEAIQEETGFRTAAKQGDTQTVRKILNDQFFQYYVTANVIQLNHIMVLDKSFELLTASNVGDQMHHAHDHCKGFLKQVKTREGVERIKPTNTLCLFMGKPSMVSVFSIGTFNPDGYIVLITDLSRDYNTIEKNLALPIQTILPSGEVFFTSPTWNVVSDDSDYIIGEYKVRDFDNQSGLTLHVARDFSSLNKHLVTLRFYALIFGTLITLIAVMLSLFFITRNALNPLHKLNKHLHRLQSDRSLLGVRLDLQANPEIMTLTNNFNSLGKELKKAYDSLERLAYTDPLTDLPNRSQLQRQLEFHCDQALQNEMPFSLFLMDLDRFKQVNDTIGHHAGDDLLKQVSERLKKILRKTDLLTRLDEWEIIRANEADVARLGGDEFAAVLPGAGNLTDAVGIAQKILSEMAKPFKVEEFEFSVGVSIGIVLCPLHANEPSSLLRKADVAMYHAKNHQLGYYIYEQHADTHSIASLSLDKDILHAIEQNDFELYYQPKIDLGKERITGVEALIRWNKDGQLIFPDQFIEHAEKTGSIHQITDWVIDTALRQSLEWQQDGIDLSIAINLSPKSLYSREVMDHILRRFTHETMATNRIYLEITESSLMVDYKRSTGFLRQVNEQGTKISIDDFGTGYSSLSKLKLLPVDEIKIDRSFVMDMLDDPNDAIIVQTIIDLAHNMKLAAVAEGVENQEILEKLKALGCDLIQGYHTGRPMPEPQLREWLKTSPWGLTKR